MIWNKAPLWIKIQKVRILEPNTIRNPSANRLDPKLHHRGKIWGVKAWGTESINISICTDTWLFFFPELGKSFCILHCPRCSVNYRVLVILTWGRAELCVNIMIIPNHPREIWSPVWLLSQLLSIPYWEVEEWRAGVLQLLALWIDHKGSLILAEHAFVYTFVKINYHILNYNTMCKCM